MQMRRKRNTSGIYREHQQSVYIQDDTDREGEGGNCWALDWFLYGRRRLEETRERMKRKNWWNVVGECGLFLLLLHPTTTPLFFFFLLHSHRRKHLNESKVSRVFSSDLFPFPANDAQQQQPTVVTTSPTSRVDPPPRQPSSSAPMTLSHPYAGCAFCLWPCISDISCRRELDYIPRIIIISSSDQRSTDCRSLTNESPASWVFEFYLDCR